MRTALSTLGLVLLLGLGSAPGEARAWQNTEVLETEIVDVDPKTRLVSYRTGDGGMDTLFVPEDLFGDFGAVRPGAFAMIEFELDTGRRELVSFRVPGAN